MIRAGMPVSVGRRVILPRLRILDSGTLRGGAGKRWGGGGAARWLPGMPVTVGRIPVLIVDRVVFIRLRRGAGKRWGGGGAAWWRPGVPVIRPGMPVLVGRRVILPRLRRGAGK